MKNVFRDYTQRYTVASLLSFIGGFLEIYTFIYRGRVFANAATGNMIFFGYHLAYGEMFDALKYFIAIVFYAYGVFVAASIQDKLTKSKSIIWHQFVLLFEILCLIAVFFIPYGKLDFVANALITFSCAMQYQAFRRVKGLPFASTMCTGNLRSGTDAIFSTIKTNDKTSLKKAIYYYGIIAYFIIGGIIGALLLKYVGLYSFFIIPIGLFITVLLITPPRQVVKIRRFFRPKRKNKNK